MSLKRRSIVSAIVFAPMLCVGCIGAGPGKFDQPPEPPVVHRHLYCQQDQKHWQWDSDDPKGWYWVDENGNKHYGDPPCEGGELSYPSGMPTTAAELGIAPDGNGQVAPMLWATNHNPVKAGEYNVDDRFDFFIASKPGWSLPHDEDPGLLEKIGESRFDYEWVALSDQGQPWAVIVGIRQVRLEHAIEFLDALGATEIVTDYNGQGPYTIKLDGPVPSGYNSALIYNDDGKLVAEIKLR
jgi:Domain of unknown function (DUF4124)